MTSIHEAVWDWLIGCPAIRDFFFSFARADNGDTALVPVGDNPIAEYIGGGSLRRCVYALVRYDAISDAPNSGENIAVILDVDRIAEWIDTQDAAGNLPAMPDGCVAEGVTVLSASDFAAQDGGQAKLMFQFALDYLKEVKHYG